MDNDYKRIYEEANGVGSLKRLREMAQVGTFDEFTVSVNLNEGPIPHFHVFKGSPESPTWETCVRFDSAEYFHHGSKQGRLSSRQRKALVKFLSRVDDPEEFPGLTNYKWAIGEWNRSNPTNRIARGLPMPDYTQLP